MGLICDLMCIFRNILKHLICNSVWGGWMSVVTPESERMACLVASWLQMIRRWRDFFCRGDLGIRELGLAILVWVEKGWNLVYGACSFSLGDGLFFYGAYFRLWLEGSSIFIMFTVQIFDFPPHLLHLGAEIETLLDESCLNREPYVMYVYAMRRHVSLCSSISSTKEHWSENVPQLYRVECLAVTSPLSNCQADILCPQESKNVCQE